MKCYKCASTKLLVEPWTRVVSPNVYESYDKRTCRDCGAFERVVLEREDKNTDNTRKLLTGNYVVNKIGKVVLRSKSKELKDLAEEVQNEIKTAELFK